MPVLWVGAVAQLGERLLCKQEVIGSIPFSSTRAAGGIPEEKQLLGRASGSDP